MGFRDIMRSLSGNQKGLPEFPLDPEVERKGAQAEKYLAFQNDVKALTDQIVAVCLKYSPTIAAPALFQAMIVVLTGLKPGPIRKQAIAEIQFGVQHLEFHVEEYHKGLWR